MPSPRNTSNPGAENDQPQAPVSVADVVAAHAYAKDVPVGPVRSHHLDDGDGRLPGIPAPQRSEEERARLRALIG
jgi:hypothetical protein